jgi:hypothetical protein
MKKTPEFNPRWARDRQPAFDTSTELDGLVGAGMKKEALALARRLLKAPIIVASEFAVAVHAILILADRVKPWKRLVEAAYERLPKRKRGSVRYWIMSARDACHDYEGVLRLVPKRFTGEFALEELIWAMEATFETNNEELMRKLAVRLPPLIDHAKEPATQAVLCLCYAEFTARQGVWETTIAAAGVAQDCSGFLQSAVRITVEIHVARALQEVEWGLKKIEAFKQKFDPEVELTIPGNEKAMLDEAAKEFRRLQKILERIVPKKRQQEFGIG